MKNLYTPDRWVLIKLITPETTYFRILAGWYGGYTSGDSWKLSSGVETFELKNDFYESIQTSESLYKCHKNSYGCSGYMYQMYSYFYEQCKQQNIEFLLLSEEEMKQFLISK